MIAEWAYRRRGVGKAWVMRCPGPRAAKNRSDRGLAKTWIRDGVGG